MKLIVSQLFLSKKLFMTIKTKLLFLGAALCSAQLISCKKDGAATPQQLTYKSVNTTILNKGEFLQFTLSFKDPAGNVLGLYQEPA